MGSYLGQQDSAVMCTQVVAEMKNPGTGETRTATDGCEIRSLKEAGWVRASGDAPPPTDLPQMEDGNGSNGGNGGSSTSEAGFATTPLLVVSGIGVALMFASDYLSTQSA